MPPIPQNRPMGLAAAMPPMSPLHSRTPSPIRGRPGPGPALPAKHAVSRLRAMILLTYWPRISLKDKGGLLSFANLPLPCSWRPYPL
jgi:hypothetical protein